MDWTIGTPTRNGLYVVKMKDDEKIGLLKLYEKEWLSYPGRFALDTSTINSKLSAYIGPIIIPEYI